MTNIDTDYDIDFAIDGEVGGLPGCFRCVHGRWCRSMNPSVLFGLIENEYLQLHFESSVEG